MRGSLHGRVEDARNEPRLLALRGRGRGCSRTKDRRSPGAGSHGRPVARRGARCPNRVQSPRPAQARPVKADREGRRPAWQGNPMDPVGLGILPPEGHQECVHGARCPRVARLARSGPMPVVWKAMSNSLRETAMSTAPLERDAHHGERPTNPLPLCVVEMPLERCFARRTHPAALLLVPRSNSAAEGDSGSSVAP